MRRRTPPRDPARLGGAIGRVLAELGHESGSPSLRLARGWDEAVGPEVAAHCEPIAWRGAVLELGVSSSVWAQHLQLRQDEILAALEGLLGDAAPTDLRFRVR